ncbi:MAG: endolysin [Wendovervirus sonii]|uniref:Endolysin n=1 Tax=phage Lak_Megaphage_Sonny TaxID=3109229 RepID=A0ABZ0Z2Z3_9CAUD|nr:MAG: endolysin [phage Lak_Megaphage_Sonny]
MGRKKKQYIIYDRDAMQEKSLLNLTLSQFKRLRVMPKWYIYVIIITVILSIFGGMLYIIITERKQHEREINMYTEELYIKEHNANFYCLIGEYELAGKTTLPADSSVYQFIIESGAWYPDIIMAQWCIESSYGTSDIAKNTNNCFGMRIVKTRPTLQIADKEYKGYGVYRNWQHSILDRVLWDLHVFDTMPNKESYLKVIQNVYAEDKNYIPKIKNIAKQWQMNINDKED